MFFGCYTTKTATQPKLLRNQNLPYYAGKIFRVHIHANLLYILREKIAAET